MEKKTGQGRGLSDSTFGQGGPRASAFFYQGWTDLTLERKAVSGIAANFRQKGQASLVQLEARHRQVMDQLVEKSGALYGAVDFFVEGDRLIFLELNTVPGIEQLESVSGANVIRELLNAKFFCQIF